MILLDTNIFIYISSGAIDSSVIAIHDVAYSNITKIEALGFHELVAQEESRLRVIFDKTNEIMLTDGICNKAIELRQVKKMSLGDAVIAATALENDLELWTANTVDFEHIEDLKLNNPMKGQL